MSLAGDLLEQAGHLARRELKRPRQASLRRSTSTAYYAIFHLSCAEALLAMAPHATEQARNKLQRMMDHSDMNQACGRFLQSPVTSALCGLIPEPVSADLRFVALAFSQLQEARHSADYDLDSEWTRSKAAGYVQLAADAFVAWARIRKSAQANIFLLALFMLKHLDAKKR